LKKIQCGLKILQVKLDNRIFPTVPKYLLEEWFGEYFDIELQKLSISELIKMDEDEIYREGKMTELFGRWIIWMKDIGFN